MQVLTETRLAFKVQLQQLYIDDLAGLRLSTGMDGRRDTCLSFAVIYPLSLGRIRMCVDESPEPITGRDNAGPEKPKMKLP